MLELTEGAVGVAVGEADRDKGGVPAPLVRVEPWSGLRPPADVVPRQDGKSLIA
jgi:hypothetical protein